MKNNDSQASKGYDFRGRFLWRLALLLVFGYINGLVYLGEFFAIYAILGVFLIPLYKVPSKWLVVLSVLLFLQIPAAISFISLQENNVPDQPTATVVYILLPVLRVEGFAFSVGKTLFKTYVNLGM